MVLQKLHPESLSLRQRPGGAFMFELAQERIAYQKRRIYNVYTKEGLICKYKLKLGEIVRGYVYHVRSSMRPKSVLTITSKLLLWMGKSYSKNREGTLHLRKDQFLMEEIWISERNSIGESPKEVRNGDEYRCKSRGYSPGGICLKASSCSKHELLSWVRGCNGLPYISKRRRGSIT